MFSLPSPHQANQLNRDANMLSWVNFAKISLVAILGRIMGDIPDCPGLVRHPNPRPEGWLQDYASRLAAEVLKADADKVRVGLDI